jgi:hypothetical protein
MDNVRMEATHPMTSAALRMHGIAAQDAYEEAEKTLAALIFQLKIIGKRHGRIAALIGAIELDPKDTLRSESSLLMLPESDFEGIGRDDIRELANSLVLARKELTESRILARSLGRNV